jgi:hypothetical protein
MEPVGQHQDAYCKATDELGQAFTHWQTEQPELAQQFGFWFDSHKERWAP